MTKIRDVRSYSGTVLGTFYQEYDRITLRRYNGEVLGYYFMKGDYTTNFSGLVIGSGNVLATLL